MMIQCLAEVRFIASQSTCSTWHKETLNVFHIRDYVIMKHTPTEQEMFQQAIHAPENSKKLVLSQRQEHLHTFNGTLCCLAKTN